jgi:hypothetical protein
LNHELRRLSDCDYNSLLHRASFFLVARQKKREEKEERGEMKCHSLEQME